MRRDIGGEIVVALGILVMIAFALMFAIILSLTGGGQNTAATTAESLTQEMGAVVSSTISLTADVSVTPVSTSTPAQAVIETARPIARATDTLVPIATETATATPSAMVTLTETAEVTDIPAPTETATETVTLSPTATVTTSATETPSATVTLTKTAVATDTPVPTATETATETLEATSTDTPTITPSVTETPSATVTETPSATATITPPATETFVPTATDTPSVTPSLTATATDTPTIRPSATATPTATNTEAPQVLGTAVVLQVTSPPPTATIGDAILPAPTASLTPTVFALISTQTGDCSIPVSWIPYEVQPGNSLFGIALAVGSSVGELREKNCLQTVDVLVEGQTLYVPGVPSGTVYTTPPTETGISGTMAQGCTGTNVFITSPISSQSITGVFTITGKAWARNLDYYKIEVRPNFTEAYSFYDRFEVSVEQGILAQLNTDFFDDGLHWIRVTVVDNNGNDVDSCTIPVFFH
jgi:hypothetical protein